MTDYSWPNDLPPFQQAFYLQPHTRRSESPFSRTAKVYHLSADRWVSSVAVRGGYDGHRRQEGFGRRMDALLAKLKGGANRVTLHDFRRPGLETWESAEEDFTDGFGFDDGTGITEEQIDVAAIAVGDTEITLPGAVTADLYPDVGDYIGGDGRPHLIVDRWEDGVDIVIEVTPPFQMAVVANDATFVRVAAVFRLTSDDAGANGSAVGEATVYNVELVEDL